MAGSPRASAASASVSASGGGYPAPPPSAPSSGAHMQQQQQQHSQAGNIAHLQQSHPGTSNAAYQQMYAQQFQQHHLQQQGMMGHGSPPPSAGTPGSSGPFSAGGSGAAPAPGNGNGNGNGNGMHWALPPGLDREKLGAMTARMAQLRQQGQTEQTSPELAGITNTLNNLQRQMARLKQMQQAQAQAQAHQHQQNGIPNGMVGGSAGLGPGQQQQQYQMNGQPGGMPGPNGMHHPHSQQQQSGSDHASPAAHLQTPSSAASSTHPAMNRNGFSGQPLHLNNPQIQPDGAPSGGTPSSSAGLPHSATSFLPQNTLSSAAGNANAGGGGERHVVLSAAQMNAFKAQIYALRFLQKGEPIPPQVAAVIFNSPLAGPGAGAGPGTGSAGSSKSGTPTPPQTAASAVAKLEESQQHLPPSGLSQSTTDPSKLGTPDLQKDGPVAQLPLPHPHPPPPQEAEVEIEELPSTLIAPYTTYRNPRQVLAALRNNVQNEMVRSSPFIPSLLPIGLDPHTLATERDKFIEARISQRRKELEEMSISALGDGPSDGMVTDLPDPDALEALPDSKKQELLASQKLKALIELKSLNLLAKQRQLREEVTRGFNQAISLTLVTDRSAYRAVRKTTLKDARVVDQLERQQKIDRENRAKQKHIDQLLAIAKHGKALEEAHSSARSRMQRLGRNILKWHVEAEKEEQKRIERISKERLKALKNNDEEAYMRLIDTAKDTRITHLLRQTDTFLDSLSQAVAAQQAEASDRDPTSMTEDMTTAGDAMDESAFGAVPVFEDEPQDKGKIDYYNVAHKIKESVTEQPKILSGGQLKEYQIKGLQWMISLYNNRLNGILADEMGLGKTIQTISLVTFLIEKKLQNGPFLCIVPLSTLPNWTLEFAKWAPSVKVMIYKGSPIIRKSLQNKMRHEGFQVCLTTYEYIIKDRPFLARYKWVHMIIDEGHRMKNTQSKLSQTLTQYYNSRYRLILTGTPLQNNLPELWALLNFVLPKVFNSQKSFDEWFNTPFAGTGGQDKIDLNEEEALLIIRRLHKVLRPFLLRRLKKDVESELPDKVERLIRCKMSALQAKLYKQMKETGMLVTDDGKGGSGSSKLGMKGLQNTIMQLRKICNHPFVFDFVENLINPTSTTNSLLYRVAGKFELLDRILPKLFAGGHRVLMFFQMTEIMNIMEDYLRYRNTKFLRLDGSTKPDERSDMLKEFNAPNSDIPIFLLSTRAGGLGLNLQTADTVVIYDSDWNPHQDLQAQDRAHRIGQKKEVRIFRLVTEKSVEEHILARAREKLEIDRKVIQGGRFDNKSSAAEREDFLRAILENAEDEEEDTADMGDDELNDLLARGEHEVELFTRMDLERIRGEENAWARAGRTGPPPQRLITDAELPDVYHIEHALQPEMEEALDQRRKKAVIHYDDGLTEEQWTAAIEDEGEDLQTHIERNRRKQLGIFPEDYSGSEPMTRNDSLQDWESEAGSPGPGGRKRKRAIHSASRATSVDVQSLNGDVKPKRRKMGKQSLAEDPERMRMKEIMEACFEAIEDVDNEQNGHQCAGLFYKLPSKRDYPEYYIIIRQPICLDQIKKKINQFKYDSLEDYIADLRLMFTNARTFNDESSVVYHDANSMEAAFNNKMAEMTGGFPTSETVNNLQAGELPKVKTIVESDDEQF